MVSTKQRARSDTELAEQVHAYGQHLLEHEGEGALHEDQQRYGEVSLQVRNGKCHLWTGPVPFAPDPRGSWAYGYIRAGCSRMEANLCVEKLLFEAAEDYRLRH